MAFYPVAGGKLINVVAVQYTPGYGKVYDGPWVESITGEAAAKPFEGWDPTALAIIKVRVFVSNTAATSHSIVHRHCLRLSAGPCTPCLTSPPTSKAELRSSETLYVIPALSPAYCAR